MRKIAIRCSTTAVLACVLMLSAAMRGEPSTGRRPDTDPEAATQTGRQLIDALLVDRTRRGAYLELRRRNKKQCCCSGKQLGEISFPASIEVIVCPQDDSPLYLVLSKSHLYIEHLSWRSDMDRPEQVFGKEILRSATSEQGRLAKRRDRRLDVFDSQGREVRPFGGNNSLHETIVADINDDGRIELTRITNYGRSDGDFARIFELFAIGKTARPILAVACNWPGADGWDYALSDRDGDGRHEIEFGPRVYGRITPEATFRWDTDRGAYVGPQGGPKDHFRTLDASDVAGELKRLNASGLRVPTRTDSSFWRSSYADRPVLQTQPESPLTSQDRSDPTTRALKEFWTTPPREAALAFAQANRSADNRREYRLAVDDRDGRHPPEPCSVIFSYTPSGCPMVLIRGECHYFLRADPAGSYLAYAGARLWGPMMGEAAFDVRFCEVPYKQARQIAQAIWWMNRLHTWEIAGRGSMSSSYSTADGDGALRWIGPQQTISVSETSWSVAFPERRERNQSRVADLSDNGWCRWTGHYKDVTFLNLSQHLLTRVLPTQLGQAWSRSDVGHPRRSLVVPRGVARDAPERTQEIRQFHVAAKRILELFIRDPQLMPPKIVNEAAGAAGAFGFADLVPLLKRAREHLPIPDEPVRTLADVDRDLEALFARNPRSTAAGVVKSDPEYLAAFGALHDEKTALRHGTVPAAALAELRLTVERSLMRLEAGEAAKP